MQNNNNVRVIHTKTYICLQIKNYRAIDACVEPSPWITFCPRGSNNSPTIAVAEYSVVHLLTKIDFLKYWVITFGLCLDSECNI